MIKSILRRKWAPISATACMLFMTACGGGASNTSAEGASASTSEVDLRMLSEKAEDPDVIVHEIGDPDRINPILSKTGNARFIQENLFESLLANDPKTLELYPHLATEVPEVEYLEEGPYAGGIRMTYEIRPEARWDNGKPIFASDYIFTIKALKNPLVQAAHIRAYLDFIDKVEVDEINPRKFSVYSKQQYMLAREASGFIVMPEYIYDPEGLLEEFTIEELDNPKTAAALAKSNPKLQQFAELFHSETYNRKPGLIRGSGPYVLKEWTTGVRIVIERKSKWWGDALSEDPHFQAYPPKITYKITPDLTTAINQLKNEEIDLMRTLPADKFKALRDEAEHATFRQLYALSSPDQLAYYYVGFNTKDPKLSDKRVRRAFAHMVDRKSVIETLFYGMAEPLNSPVNPNKDYYHKGLAAIEFSPEKAKALLTEAGWSDTDGDGILDKMIDGEQVDMRVRYVCNNSNEVRKQMGLMLQEVAKRLGVEVELVTRDWSVYLESLKARDFDLFALAWVQGPYPDDFIQAWHTQADTYDGDNRVGFGNAESDAVIEAIREARDKSVRDSLYLRFQEIVYEEQPYIFLGVPKERIAIHKRFDHRETSVLRPGYLTRRFKLNTVGASDVQ